MYRGLGLIRGVFGLCLIGMIWGVGCADPYTAGPQGPRPDATVTEAGHTIDPCWPGNDTDKDGIPDEVEGCGPPPPDTDNDGLPDYIDIDADGDGISDQTEGTADLDGDGVPNYKDNDSDGDGVDDQDEDLNGDGKLGCCLQTCGEVRKGCPPAKPDECGPGQLCQGGQCQPPRLFLCSDGETDPRNTATFGTGQTDAQLPTFVCHKPDEQSTKGLKAIDYNKSEPGNWKVALEAGTPYGELTIDGGDANEAAGAFDYGLATQVVGGFVVTFVAETAKDITELGTGVIDKIKSGLSGADAVQQLSSGNRIESHDKFPSIVSSQLSLKMKSPHKAGAVRNLLYPALLGKAVQKGGMDNYGPDATDFLLRFEAQLRDDGRLVVIGGVTPVVMANDPSKATSSVLDDISNGTGLATAADSDTVECDPFQFERSSIADIIWVVDESGSMSNNLQDIVNNANDFFTRAIKSGLDFRMGVAGVADPTSSNPFQTGVKVGKFCSDPTKNPGLFPGFGDGGDDRFLLPSEQASFKACVADPPFKEGSSEYGLAHAIEGVTRHLPRAPNDPTKIRPDATIVVIIATDEAPKELKGGEYRGVTGPTYDAEGCSLTAKSEQEILNYLELWTDLFTGKDPKWGEQAKAQVHLIGGLCSSTGCSPEVGHGYLELVKATGGIAADICQKNLGSSLQIIIDTIGGAASQSVLQYVPISASLAVAVDNKQLVRSRVQGFDYVGFSNSLVFVGVPIKKGNQIVASYRRWVKQAVIN